MFNRLLAFFKPPVFPEDEEKTRRAPEYHERIFKLFDKLDSTSEGTGVGLALVKVLLFKSQE